MKIYLPACVVLLTIASHNSWSQFELEPRKVVLKTSLSSHFVPIEKATLGLEIPLGNTWSMEPEVSRIRPKDLGRKYNTLRQRTSGWQVGMAFYEYALKTGKNPWRFGVLTQVTKMNFEMYHEPCVSYELENPGVSSFFASEPYYSCSKTIPDTFTQRHVNADVYLTAGKKFLSTAVVLEVDGGIGLRHEGRKTEGRVGNMPDPDTPGLYSGGNSEFNSGRDIYPVIKFDIKLGFNFTPKGVGSHSL